LTPIDTSVDTSVYFNAFVMDPETA
jgi:hypothetical protein